MNYIDLAPVLLLVTWAGAQECMSYSLGQMVLAENPEALDFFLPRRMDNKGATAKPQPKTSSFFIFSYKGVFGDLRN